MTYEVVNAYRIENYTWKASVAAAGAVSYIMC